MTAAADKAAIDAFMRLEDAYGDAKECAAVLASYFELLATRFNDDTVAMFTAMGHESLARDIMKRLDAMLAAASEIVEGAR